MLTDIVKYLPSPADCKITGINANTNEVYEANYDFSKPKSAYVFKTIVDPFVGKYSLIKVNSGVLKTDDLLYNKHKETEEKIGKLYILTGSKAEEVPELLLSLESSSSSIFNIFLMRFFTPEFAFLSA